MTDKLWVIGPIGWGDLQDMKLVVGGTEQQAVDRFVEEGDDYGMEYNLEEEADRSGGIFVYELKDVSRWNIVSIPTPRHKLVRVVKPKPRKGPAK